MAVKVGSFAKSTNTSVPVTQAITGVGFQPRAAILWTTGATRRTRRGRTAITWQSGLWRANAADTITEGSRSASGQDNAATTNTSQRTVSDKALTIVEWGEALLAECDLASFDADGFTPLLDNQQQRRLHHLFCYMALGGPDITDACVKSWASWRCDRRRGGDWRGFRPRLRAASDGW